MKKISLRINDDILKEVDSYVDLLNIKNRSQAIKYLLKQSLGTEKSAVILCKGLDNEYQNLKKNLLVAKNQYNSLIKLKNNLVLIQNQVKQLKKFGFGIIYIINIEQIIEEIKPILSKEKGVIFHFITIDNVCKTLDAIKLLNGKIANDFLVIFSDVYFDINLNDLFNNHKKNDTIGTLTVMSSNKPNIKGCVEISGTIIKRFVEKPKKEKINFVFEPVFILSSKIFEMKGQSLVYDLFPKLAKDEMLQGFLSSGHIIHLHKLQDKEKINELL
jgi:NDP-sugar pyrophosphorylase family protein